MSGTGTRAGEAEAVEAATRTREFRAGVAFDVPGDAVQRFVEAVIAAAYPIIAEAVSNV